MSPLLERRSIHPSGKHAPSLPRDVLLVPYLLPIQITHLPTRRIRTRGQYLETHVKDKSMVRVVLRSLPTNWYSLHPI